MFDKKDFIEYGTSRLYYAKAGHGHPLLIFHGFGQSAEAFSHWVEPLKNQYTLYAFDLYFHGLSRWPEERALEKTDWQNVLIEFLKKENLLSFDVAGFSLGGKFALATLEAFPDRTNKLILIAPDGIHNSFWYRVATYPYLTRRLFKSMVLNPGRFYGLARFFREFGLISKGIVRFAESQMDTEEKRRRVYSSWVCFRHLSFSLDNIAGVLNQRVIPLVLIAGRYDKVIPLKRLKPFLNKLNQQRLEIVESGHADLLNYWSILAAGN